ncbi:UDP-N-acetylmuramoyl-tripeptide--D-alanyl-D-alanine ligase [Clostridium sp. DL1XJH146]
MEKLTFDEILKAVSGKSLINSGNEYFNRVETDTRKNLEDCIFFALTGENFNGNKFVEEASNKGASLCIVDEEIFDKCNLKKKTSIILVNDTKKALLELAEYYRNKLKIKVVGITGSTGKTSTKDILAAMLSSKYKVFKTKGNFNNEIGLPLMIFKLDNSYDIAVLEMGMSNLGEIDRLAKTAKPDMAIITNIGDSHLEFLKTRENILRAKMEITNYFHANNLLIVNSENDLLREINKGEHRLIKTGYSSNEDFYASDVVCRKDSIGFNLYKEGKFEQEFTFDLIGKHNVLNSLLCIACADELGISFDEMKKGLRNIERTSMRLEIKKTDYITIINDCYNASPDSMRAAIDILSTYEGRKIAILGTMKELGDNSSELHRSIGEYALLNNIDLIVTIGECSEDYCRGFSGRESYQFKSVEKALIKLHSIVDNKDVVLIKASRYMKFEHIVEFLLKYEG